MWTKEISGPTPTTGRVVVKAGQFLARIVDVAHRLLFTLLLVGASWQSRRGSSEELLQLTQAVVSALGQVLPENTELYAVPGTRAVEVTRRGGPEMVQVDVVNLTIPRSCTSADARRVTRNLLRQLATVTPELARVFGSALVLAEPGRLLLHLPEAGRAPVAIDVPSGWH